MKRRGVRKDRRQGGRDKASRARFWFIAAGVSAGVGVLAGLLYAVVWHTTGAELTKTPRTDAVRFIDARVQAEEFISHYHSIALTHEQQKVMDEALTPMRAPCCNQYSMATCCCPCNFAKSVWGLSKLLIGQHGYDVAEVRSTVEDWVHFINPNGYSGDVCSTRGCNRPFEQNGCGGMDEAHVR